MNQLIGELRASVAAFDAEIDRTEQLLDRAAQILEEARIERDRIRAAIELEMLTEAIEYPGVIYR